MLFRLWPVAFNEHKVRTPDLNLPRRGPPLFSFSKPYKRLKVRLRERPKTIHISKDIVIDTEDDEESVSYSDSEAPTPVPIDTSGTGFYRMESLRRSLTEPEGGTIDRKRRRRTVSGVPEAEAILRELKSFEKTHKTRGSGVPRNEPRPYSFDELNPDFQIERDEVMAQYFNEVDALIEERHEEERARKEFKLLKFLPCRRSRSLPRCVKLNPKSVAEHARIRGESSTGSGSYASSLSLTSGHSGVSSHVSRSTKRSSIISSKLRSLVSGAVSKARPKSLDLDSIELCPEPEPEGQLSKRSSPSMPENIGADSNVRRRSQVGPGTYYYFENNTLPRAQAKKYDFPWESLPKDWTTSVKMREISKRRSIKEDRQSSSGNWSASSCSNRQSLESGKSSMPSSTSQHSLCKDSSQHSLGKDSGRDSPTPTEGGRYAADAGMQGDDEESVTGGEGKSHFTKMDTDAWLQSLARRAASREDVSSSSAQTLQALTRQNILALDLMSPVLRQPCRMEDEDSLYSVDQEGFYTSFHTDSGLRQSTGTLIDSEGEAPLAQDLGEESGLKPVTATQSMLSMSSTNTMDSVIFRPLGSSRQPSSKRDGVKTGKKEGGKVPPPPPPRRSSVKEGQRVEGSGNSSGNFAVSLQAEDTPDVADSAAESDQETVYARLKLKTQISSQAFPSMCTVSSVSDEDNSPPQSREQLFLKDGSRAPANRPTDIPLAYCLSQPPFEVSQSGKPLSGQSGARPSLQASSSSEEPGTQGEETWEGGTLPRRYVATQRWEEEADYANSWPRDGKKATMPGASILKTEKTSSLQRPSKTLNFAPMVNMFDHGLTQSVQMPLPSLSSSSSSRDDSTNSLSSSKSPLSPDGGSYKLAMPLLDASETASDDSKGSKDASLPLKYQPTITVTPRARPQLVRPHKEGAYVKMVPSDNSGSKSIVIYPSKVTVKAAGTAGATPQNMSTMNGVPGMGDSATSSTMSTDGSSDLSSHRSGSNLSLPSLSSSVTSSLTSSEGGYVDVRNVSVARGSDTTSTGSSINFSDFDSSLTYVSMNTPSSTRSNSTLTLTPTPTDSEATSLADSGRGEQESSSTESTPTNQPRHRHNKGEVDMESFLRVETTRPSAPPFSTFFSTNTFTSSPSQGVFAPRPELAISPMSGDTGFCDSSPDSVESLVIRQGGLPHSSTWHGSSSAQLKRAPDLNPSHFLSLEKAPLLPQNGKSSSSYASKPQLRKSSTKSLAKSERRRSSPGDSRLSLNSTLSMNSIGETSSLSSSQSSLSSCRSDSYRVAMMTEVGQTPQVSSRQDSYRVAMGRQQSAPPQFFTQPDPEVDVNRADSYRVAVRNTNGLVAELPDRNCKSMIGDPQGRNSSYRFAVRQESAPVGNSRLDALNQWDGKSGGGRDYRRMGITDVDQLKCYSSAPLKTGTAPHFPSSGSGGSSKPSMKSIFATINSYNKKVNIKRDIEALLKPEASTGGTGVTKGGLGGGTKGAFGGGKGGQGKGPSTPRDKGEMKVKAKDRPLSSTYVSFDPFDPIMEDQDDSPNSSADTVRAAPIRPRPGVSKAPSMDTVPSEDGPLLGHKITSNPGPRGRRSGDWVGGRRSMDDKTGSTILGSLKTTFKSISGRKSEKDDDWKYETGV